jgi:hypothetical protein
MHYARCLLFFLFIIANILLTMKRENGVRYLLDKLETISK